LSNPFSTETPSRFGPRNCGQSSAANASVNVNGKIREIWSRDFIRDPRNEC